MDVQQISDHLEITALLNRAGSRDEVTEWLSQAFEHLPMSQHYVTNIEITPIASDLAKVRAMFYNPMQLPGMAELSYCGGYYHHEPVRTSDGWRSRKLVEENAWFVNHPSGA